MKSVLASSENPAQAGGWTLSSLILVAGFSLTGAGTVLLGVALPVLARRWNLDDAAAGSLFLAQFLGSALGAVVTTSRRVLSLRIGYVLLTGAAASLAAGNAHLSIPIFFVYGLGLGMAMTSTSLLFSDRYPQQRAEKMEVINFAWSAGAMAGPALFFPFLHAAGFRLLCSILAGVCLAFLGWSLCGEREIAPPPAGASPPPAGAGFSKLLLLLIAMALCAVGVESSFGGWLASYSQRSAPGLGAAAAFSISAFFAGIMAGRLALSTRLLAKIGRRSALRICLWGMAISAAALLSAQSPAAILVAAGLCGVFVGPVYPLLLSFLLELSPRGWIFAAGGVGSVIFPWLTGILSARCGSLRCGLAAPCAAIVLTIVLRAAMPRQHTSAPSV